MSSLQDQVPLIGTILDLVSISANFPSAPQHEILRDNVVNTIKTLVQDTYSAAIEGPEGIGKTTLLAQFARRNHTSSISLFISAANRFSYDPDLMRLDIASQVHWCISGEPLDRSTYDPALLKNYYSDLQQRARNRRLQIYFLIDGIDDLEASERQITIQHLADILPLGIPQFRFLFAGDEALYRGLLGPRINIKSFPLTEFGIEETRSLFKHHDIDLASLNEVNSICRGIPGRLAGVLRALDKGTTLAEFIQYAPSKWPEFFETDWKQLDATNVDLQQILALLAHDPKPHSIQDIAEILNMPQEKIRLHLASLNFINIDGATAKVTYATAGLRRYAADKLKLRRPHIQKLLIKRLLSSPQADTSLLELPAYMEEASEYSDLLSYLTPDHILQILERTQTLSRVDETVRRGFRSARKMGRDADILRFGLQQSIISNLASANAWQSEVAALSALNRDAEALALANNAILREDRLQMLTTLAHHTWLRGATVSDELRDQIRLLIDNLDPWSLGRRAEDIATQLTCVSPDLATSVLRKAKWGKDEDSLDEAFARFTVSALKNVKDAQRRSQVLETVARSRQETKSNGILEGVRVLTGKFTPAEVCERSNEIAQMDARLGVLRYWCVLNGSVPDADLVATHALSLAIATSSTRLDADFLADLAQALRGAQTDARKKELIGILDGLRATAERLGPSVDYVRLQLSIAVAEMDLDPTTAEGRLLELVGYAVRIADLPSRGQAHAQLLAALRALPTKIKLESGTALEEQCTKELDDVVLTLSESTADHYLALGGIISGLAPGDLPRALDYTKIVNTEGRRDAVLIDVTRALLHRSLREIDPSALKTVVDRVAGDGDRDEMLTLIMHRMADGPISTAQAKALMPIMAMLPEMSDSMSACQALVNSLKIIDALPHAFPSSFRDHSKRSLIDRWRNIDIGWARVDAGYGIARDIAAFSAPDAEEILRETDAIRAEWRIAGEPGASTFIQSVRILIRAFCGLLPRRLEKDADRNALVALIEVLPSDGERAVLWADLCMRAFLAGRPDMAELLTKERLQPAFSRVSSDDRSYRASVLIRVSPAFYKAAPATFLEVLETVTPDDRDAALLQTIRFLLRQRVPSDPVDSEFKSTTQTSYETLLQVEALTVRLTTDWMIFSVVEDVADAVGSAKNKYTITYPQREDISRRFSIIADEKLPSKRHIAHMGFRVATRAQAIRIRQTKAADWETTIREAKLLDNVADRVYVLQIVALCLPSSMSDLRASLLEKSSQEIDAIPWQYDRIERILGLADDLHRSDIIRARELIHRAATCIASSTEDVREQRRHLVDTAYRVDEELAKRLIDKFDDDQAKKRAQSQIKMLEVRKTIIETEGRPDEDRLLMQVREAEVHKLGLMLLRALNSGRIQHFHPNQIRDYVELAAQHPLDRSYPLLTWYIENVVIRYSQTDQASQFVRPLFDACVVGTQLAGQISGKSLIRLKALKHHSAGLSSAHSILVTPESRDEAMEILRQWLERKLGDEVKIHDPFFAPMDLPWLQLIRAMNPKVVLTIMTSRRNQPSVLGGDELQDLYLETWRRLYDQVPPRARIAIIGGERTGESPIHDRWLLSGGSGLRFGASLNYLGITKDSEISEMSAEDAKQKEAELGQYLEREKTEYRSERLRLTTFWL
jgi:hypothetical protein